jgi:sarcosine oxidase/L-pipecolate oxidase
MTMPHLSRSAARADVSGHAFKYAPIIGREILKVVQRNPSPELAGRWAFDRSTDDAGADVRDGVRQVLREEDMAKPEDLKAPAGITVAA